MTHRPGSAVRHTLDGTIRGFLAEALIFPTGLLISAFLTRQFGPGLYGQFVLAITLITWIEWSVRSLLSAATVKAVSEAPNWQSVGVVAVRMQLFISSAVAAVLFLSAAHLARLFGEPEMTGLLRLFSLDIPLFALSQSYRDLLVGTGRFNQRAFASAARWISRLVLVLLLVGLGLSATGAVLASLGASLVDLGVCYRSARVSIFTKSTFPARKLWSYAGPLFLASMAMRLYDKLDLFALKLIGIGTVASAASAGIYGAAQNLALVPAIVGLAFSPLLLSSLTRLRRQGNLTEAAHLARMAQRGVLTLLPFAALGAGSAGEIVLLLFGPQYVQAGPILAILLVGALAALAISVCNQMIIAAGKPAWTLALSGVLLPIAVAGHLLMIPRFGLHGAACVTSFSACCGALSGLVVVYRLWHIHPPIATLCRSVLLCLMAFPLARYWPTPHGLVLLKLPLMSLLILGGYVLLGEVTLHQLNPLALLGRRTTPSPVPAAKTEAMT